LYSWIDTEKDNFPEPLDLDFVISAFSLLEHFFPAVVRMFLVESFEMRLGKKFANLGEVAIELD